VRNTHDGGPRGEERNQGVEIQVMKRIEMGINSRKASRI
jgi:hypothetical protein